MKIKALHLCFSFAMLSPVGVVEIAYATDSNLSRQEITEARRSLTQATILLKSGKPAEANALLKERFPNGPPAGDLAVGYYKIIASFPGGWSEARAGLEALVKSDRKNLQYSLALDALLGSKIETRDLAFQNLAEKYNERKVDKQRVLQTWREVLSAQEPSPELLPYYQKYLEVDPHNQEITGKWMLEKDALTERKRIANDPLLRRRQVGLDLLDKGDIVGAEAPLKDTLKDRPNDYLALGGMGVIRMRQSNYEEAIAYYQKALALNPENSGKWKSLISTSQYWLQIRQAEDARDKKNYPLAMEKIRAAINLEPQGAEAIAVLGTIEAERGNSKEAEKQFREALNIEADNGIALRGLVQLLINSGKRDEALALINARAPETSPAGKGYDYLRVKIFSSQADDLVSKGQSDAAIPYLQRALKLEPLNPWLRFQLAGIYEGLGRVDQGLMVMKEGLRLAPHDPEMINANVLFLLSADKTEDALILMRSALAKPSSDATSLRLTYANVLNRLQRDDELGPVLLQLSKAKLSASDKAKFTQIRLDFDIRLALKAGDTKKAIALLNQAIALDQDEVWLRLDLARLYAQVHRPKEGVAVFDTFLKTHPKSVEGLYAYALYLSGLEQNPAALKVLERIPASERTPKITRFQRGVWVDLQLTQVKRLNAQGEKAKANAQLTALEHEVSNDPDLSSLVAVMWGTLGKVEQGNALFQKIEKANPSLSVDWHLRYANYLLTNDQPDAFQKEMTFLSGQKFTPGQKQDYADLQQTADLKAIDQLIQSGDIRMANQKLQPLIAAAPKTNNYKVMYRDSQIQRREGYLDKAIDIEQRALAQAPVPLSSYHSLSTLKPVSSTSGVSVFQIEPPILEPSAASSGSAYQYKQMADMIEMRTNWLDSAVDYLSLNGTPGQSYYRATEIPLEWKMPMRSDERMTFRADQVNINAGTIDGGNSYQVKTFGTMATVCGGGTGPGKCPTGYSNQSASGTALNIGYEKQNFKADIGTTPLGFLTQNWIGGVKQKLDVGPVGVSLELARRPMTSTLLSYAGARDPVTGSVWGGMIATGGTIGLSLDQGGTLGGWTYYRARSLTGTNVQSNSDNQFMAGLNWRIVNETDRQLSSGLTGMLWGFKNNAGEFTYGQGGYYSPQSYRSVTIPLNYAQRFARFSYVVGGSVSTNWSRTDAAPYFPTNVSYQNAAAANNPTYTASSGPGSAYSAMAAWEYQVTPSVFLGNRIKLERSPYYAPNSVVLYVRIALDGVAPSPVPLQTQPVIPTSRF